MNESFVHEEIFPSIYIYRNIIQNPNHLIQLSNAFPEAWRSGGVTSTSGEEILDNDYRIAESITLSVSYTQPSEWFELSKLMWQYGNDYAIKNKIEFSEMEPVRIVRYPENSGVYKPHHDSCPTALRIFSSVLYLNTLESGGETFFPKFNFGFKPEAGTIIFFPANYAYTHESKSSKNEKKFVAVTQYREVIR